jgi:hypothetical protein
VLPSQLHLLAWIYTMPVLMPAQLTAPPTLTALTCPALPCLTPQELCRARQRLAAAGGPPAACDAVREGALRALSLYSEALVSHLRAVPQMVRVRVRSPVW